MATFTVKKEAYIKYQLTTWQGEVNVNGEHIKYRYSEDDNGAELYTFQDEEWVVSDLSNLNHKVLWAAFMEWGSPEELGGAGEELEIDDEFVEDYI